MRQLKLLVGLAVLVATACGSDNGGGDKDAGADALVPVNLTHEQLIEACVRLYACNVERKPRIQDCVNYFYDAQLGFGYRRLYQTLYACANQGTGDCKAIRECLGYTSRMKTGECDSSFTPTCEGTVAKSCDLVGGGLTRAVDCARAGLKCAVRATGTGTKDAVCTIDTCNKDLFKPECRADQLLTCVGGAIQMNDCGALQLQCRDPGIGLCEGTGRSCSSATTTPKCDGNKVVDCVQNYLSEIDCSKEPGKKRCDANSSPIKCVGAGSECDTNYQTTFDECQGDSLVVCIDGFKRTFDCKKMGFLGCETATTYGANCKAEPVYD